MDLEWIQLPSDESRDLTKLPISPIMKTAGPVRARRQKDTAAEKAVGRSLVKGGDASVEESFVLRTAVSGVSGVRALHTDHKRALTARLAPSGQL